MAELNKQGGILAQTKLQLDRAKDVDLITLPRDIDGTNCGNCKFIHQRYCRNPRVDQPVNNRECCVLWSGKGEYRQFKGRNKEYGED